MPLLIYPPSHALSSLISPQARKHRIPTPNRPNCVFTCGYHNRRCSGIKLEHFHSLYYLRQRVLLVAITIVLCAFPITTLINAVVHTRIWLVVYTPLRMFGFKPHRLVW